MRSGKTQTTPASVASGGLKNVANKFLGVVELDPTTGDLHVRSGGSLQKNLDKTGHVLEEGAVETAAIIEKGVLNPFTKLTKGLGAVLKGKYNLLFMIMPSKIFMQIVSFIHVLRYLSKNGFESMLYFFRCY